MIDNGQVFLDADFSCEFPRKFNIDISSVCNLRCVGCPTAEVDEIGYKGIISFADFKRIFQKIKKYAGYIELFSWGEPFLCRDIIKILDLCSSCGVRTEIHSNLSTTRFSDQFVSDLVRAGSNTLLVASIDGASQETYSKYRIRGSFERAISNLARIQEAKERLSVNKPDLKWKFLVNAYNEHEIGKAKCMAASLRVPVVFPLMDPRGDEWKTQRHRQLESHVDHHPRPYFPVKLPAFVNLNNLPPLFNTACFQPFCMPVISHCGGVSPCCQIYGKSSYIANILEEDFEKIWNKDLGRIRRQLFSYDPSKPQSLICEKLGCNITKADQSFYFADFRASA
ncbi:MAG: radical SAM/SPASM domain-containing protein [Syntrophobacteraceae bacterium]